MSGPIQPSVMMLYGLAMERTLLVVDDEPNILSSLKRLFRREGYQLFSASSGSEGLGILAENNVGVIISDQRMPEMTGVEFLSQVKKNYPNTTRIILSGYTDLNSVTDAINKGEIYKFLTKPWDDDLLRKNVKLAFDDHEMRIENERLTKELNEANGSLSKINEKLEQSVLSKTKELMYNYQALELSQTILDNLPVAVVGIDDAGVIATANKKAQETFHSERFNLIGSQIADVFPEQLIENWQNLTGSEFEHPIEMKTVGAFKAHWVPLDGRGYILALKS